MPDVTNPDCKALICCGGEDFFENYSSAGPDEDLFFNEEVSYTSECPPNYNCIPATVTIPANANRPARNKTPDHPASPAEPPGPAPCFGPFTGATQAEANAAALECAKDAANSQTVITGPIIFYNTEQTVTCPEGYAGGPFIVPANTTSSLISQAAANAQALAMAQALADAGCVPSSCEGCLSSDGRVIVGDFPSACCAAPVSGAALEDYIFVANNTAGNVSVIDVASDTEIAQIPIGSDPRNMVYDWLSNKVYVNAVGGIYVIDPTTLAVTVGPIALPGGVTAADLAGRLMCFDSVNSKVYIPGVNSGTNVYSIISIDTTADTASTLVSLPAGTPAVDSYSYGARCGHSSVSNQIYVWYAFQDLVDGSNNEFRVKVYNPAGTEVDEIFIADGDAFGSEQCLTYAPEVIGKVYTLGRTGDTATATLKVIDPGTNTVTATLSGASYQTASLDFNEAQDLLVVHNSAGTNNVVFVQATSTTVTCVKTCGTGTSGDGYGQPASIDGITFVPRVASDDVVIYACSNCTFENTEQTVECPMGETGGPFVVPAGTYTSCVSVADANDLAIADGQALADAECMACTNHPVQDLVWTLTGNSCGGVTAAGGSASFSVPPVGAAGICTASATLEGSCNEYILDIECTAYNVGTTSFLDGPSAASAVRIRVDGATEFEVVQNPGAPGCTQSSGGPNSVQHTIPAGVGTHALELIVQNGSLAFPPGPCTCTATFSLTPLTPP